MKKLRVMIVEDNQIIAGLLAELIEAIGHEVCGIESGESGSVAGARRLRPDLMIVDVNLQDGSGIGAVEAITRELPHPAYFRQRRRFRRPAAQAESDRVAKALFRTRSAARHQVRARDGGGGLTGERGFSSRIIALGWKAAAQAH